MGASSPIDQGPTRKSKSRTNGWSWPPHAFQVIAWCVIIYLAVFFYCTTIPSFVPAFQYALYPIISVIIGAHLIVHLVACSINPADTAVLQKLKSGDHELASFDRTQHRHVIENCHCYICGVDVSTRSKHCSTCNKCVEEFDHHCKWLNNCVGGRNYRLFIATLASAAVGSLTIFTFCLVQFIAYFTDSSEGNILLAYREVLMTGSTTSIPVTSTGPNNSSTTTEGGETGTTEKTTMQSAQFYLFYGAVPAAAWLAMTLVTAVLALVACILLAHLLGFHVYLMIKKLSTYDYIVNERTKDEQVARDKQAEFQVNEIPMTNITNSNNKLNKVVPTTDTEPATTQSEFDTRWATKESGETPRNGHHILITENTVEDALLESKLPRRKKKKRSTSDAPNGISRPIPVENLNTETGVDPPRIAYSDAEYRRPLPAIKLSANNRAITKSQSEVTL